MKLLLLVVSPVVRGWLPVCPSLPVVREGLVRAVGDQEVLGASLVQCHQAAAATEGHWHVGAVFPRASLGVQNLSCDAFWGERSEG